MNAPPVIVRTNLTLQVYGLLRDALLEGRLRPHRRLRIRDLSNALNVSETPVREAVMQLVRERALELQTARSLTVPRLSLATFLELREIRLELEGLAASKAAQHLGKRELTLLERADVQLIRATAAGNWVEVVASNWRFHATIYKAAGMPDLFNIIEGLWLRCGPMFSQIWPASAPAYQGRRRHLDALDAVRAADSHALCAAIRADLVEGSASLVRAMEAIEAGHSPEPLPPEAEDDLATTLRPSFR